jgi:tetratricopeptide (TPR) repeat protein
MRLFTTGEVENILHLPGSRIRSFVRAGFLKPVRGKKQSLQFTFQDVLFLKTAKSLLEAHVPSKKIVRMLSSLKRQLPGDQHLSSLKIYADGRRVIAWDGKARWQPESGQFLFNFDARAVVQQLRPAQSEAHKLTAEHWFNVALELEASSIHEAQRAYHLAIQLEPRMSDAHLNIGRLYHEQRDFQKAAAHYRATAASAPDDAAPHFNLGVLLEDANQPQAATRAYQRALKLDPGFADAHYNLGLICEAHGKKADALLHFRAARKIYLEK